jgi:hypothetical protein
MNLTVWGTRSSVQGQAASSAAAPACGKDRRARVRPRARAESDGRGWKWKTAGKGPFSAHRGHSHIMSLVCTVWPPHCENQTPY